MEKIQKIFYYLFIVFLMNSAVSTYGHAQQALKTKYDYKQVVHQSTDPTLEEYMSMYNSKDKYPNEGVSAFSCADGTFWQHGPIPDMTYMADNQIDSALISSCGGNPDRCLASDGSCTCHDVQIITVNGKGADLGSPFHEYIKENVPDGIIHSMDPWGEGSIGIEGCFSNPQRTAEELDNWVAELQRKYPCTRFVIVGHSLGGVATRFMKNTSVCKVIINPPECPPWLPPLSQTFCPTPRGICKAEDGGIRRSPDTIITPHHTPFNFEPNDTPDDIKIKCQSLLDVYERVRQCINKVSPDTIVDDVPLFLPEQCLNISCVGGCPGNPNKKADEMNTASLNEN